MNVLDMKACRSGHTVNQGWLPPVPCLGSGKSLRPPQGLRKPAGYLQNSAAEKALFSMQIGRGGVPGSHLGEASDVHQGNADSGFIPMLSLKPLTIVPEHTEASHHTSPAFRLSRFIQEKLPLKLGLVACHQKCLQQHAS